MRTLSSVNVLDQKTTMHIININAIRYFLKIRENVILVYKMCTKFGMSLQRAFDKYIRAYMKQKKKFDNVLGVVRIQNAEIPHFFFFWMREKGVELTGTNPPIGTIIKFNGYWNSTFNLNIIYVNSNDRTCYCIIPVLRVYLFSSFFLLFTPDISCNKTSYFMYTCPKWFLRLYSFFLTFQIDPIKCECKNIVKHKSLSFTSIINMVDIMCAHVVCIA